LRSTADLANEPDHKGDCSIKFVIGGPVIEVIEQNSGMIRSCLSPVTIAFLGMAKLQADSYPTWSAGVCCLFFSLLAAIIVSMLCDLNFYVVT